MRLEAVEPAEPDVVYVVDERMRSACRTSTLRGTVNLRTTFAKIIRRPGLPAWPRLFQNLRSSREAELVEKYPLQNVTDWMGNTPKVAMRH